MAHVSNFSRVSFSVVGVRVAVCRCLSTPRYLSVACHKRSCALRSMGCFLKADLKLLSRSFVIERSAGFNVTR